MSIYKIKNATQEPITLTWLDDKVLAVGELYDIIDDLKLSIEEFIGIQGGSYYDQIKALITTGGCKLNDGDGDLCMENSSYLLKYGRPSYIYTKNTFSGFSSTAFESHNLMNVEEWNSEIDSSFEIAPLAGKMLLLTGSKTLISEDCVPNDKLVFKVYAGEELVKEIEYENIEKLMLGANKVYQSPQIGNPVDGGSRSLVHVLYKYEEPISLRSDYGMKVVVGFKDNTHPVQNGGQVLRLRFNAISLPL